MKGLKSIITGAFLTGAVTIGSIATPLMFSNAVTFAEEVTVADTANDANGQTSTDDTAQQYGVDTGVVFRIIDDEGNPVQGVSFGLYTEVVDGNDGYKKDIKIDTKASDENGLVHANINTANSHVVTDYELPAGYVFQNFEDVHYAWNGSFSFHFYLLDGIMNNLMLVASPQVARGFVDSGNRDVREGDIEIIIKVNKDPNYVPETEPTTEPTTESTETPTEPTTDPTETSTDNVDDSKETTTGDLEETTQTTVNSDTDTNETTVGKRTVAASTASVKGGSNSVVASTTTSANTGDTNHTPLWIALSATAAAVATTVGVMFKRKRNS